MPPMKESTKALREKTPKSRMRTRVSKGIQRAKTSLKNQRKSMLRAMGSVGVFFILIVMVAAMYSNYSTTKLVNIIEGQLTALRNGNVTSAYSYTSKDFQESVSLSGFKKFVNEYSPLKYNLTIYLTESSRSGSEGSVTGKLVSRDGRTAKVTYHMVKEGNYWKISYIQLTRTAGVNFSENIELSKLFESKSNYFTIQFPKTWIILSSPNRKLTFSGPKGSLSYNSTITIQGFGSKLAQGQYNSVDEIIADLKKQLAEVAFNVKLVEQGAIRLPLKPNQFQGRYLVFTYVDEGYMFKKLVQILERSDKRAFYIFDYTSPIQQFNADLPVAKAMYATWDIE